MKFVWQWAWQWGFCIDSEGGWGAGLARDPTFTDISKRTLSTCRLLMRVSGGPAPVLCSLLAGWGG